ncbi:MAG: radical SAM protein [Phycisphaerae bacterium]|nr:radical SAM protein [Phycisphaerae bacterium]
MSRRIKVNEIYCSIQGETTWTGWRFAFVRLAGCNLRCRWCDTPAARGDGQDVTIDDLMDRVATLRCGRVLVTGGEPLVQQATPELLRRLCDAEYRTLLETNGSRDLSDVDARVIKIVDVKCPASGQAGTTRRDALEALGRDDEVKFVIADGEDYAYACDVVGRYALNERVAVTFSPVFGEVDPAELAGWLLADRLDVRLGLQVHKILWPGRSEGI